MKKIIIGILPQIKLKTNDNPYDDRYEFLDLYTKKIIENDAIPVGICLKNGKLDYDSLEICDAILIPGGNKVWPCYYQTIHYAIMHNKPLLGICLGLEGMAIYSCVTENMNDNFTEQNFCDAYERLKEENDGTLLQKIEEPNIHNKVYVNYDNADEARHDIEIIDKDSIIYTIYNKSKLDVVSLHSYNPKWIGKNFKITAQTSDGVVEAIEYNNKNYFIVGVHFHPEWDKDDLLFKKLIEEGKKRKNEKYRRNVKKV